MISHLKIRLWSFEKSDFGTFWEFSIDKIQYLSAKNLSNFVSLPWKFYNLGPIVVADLVESKTEEQTSILSR